MYSLCRWNTAKCHLYDYRQHWMYCLRRRVDFQYDHQCGNVYHVCGSLRGRNHLSVHGMYRDNQSRLYDMYYLCRWNTPKHGMYCFGQHRMYLLRRWVDLQYDHKRSRVYGMCHSVRGWKIPIDCLYYHGQSNMYLVRSRNLL